MAWPGRERNGCAEYNSLVLREEAQQAGGAAKTEADRVWRCAACAAEVARDRHRIPLDGAATRAFVNPDGIEYVIAGFSEAPGCAEVSNSPFIMGRSE